MADRHSGGRGHRSGSSPRRGTGSSGGRSGRDARARERDQRALENTFISRRNVVLGLFGAAAALGIWRLADYQVVNAGLYQHRADQRRLSRQVLFAKRGTIYDRNGNVLASSVECQNVYVNPTLIKDVDGAVEALVDVLGVDAARARELCTEDTTFNYIQRQVEQEDADLLAERGIAGIEFEQSVKRVYPYGNLASQLLGVVNLDNKGISGLESYYDEILTGKNGSLVRERARDGSFIAGGAYEKVPAQDGTDIVLTIDVNIQTAAEEVIAQAVEDTSAKNGSVLVCDPSNGEILAACSNPTYDQGDLSNARTEDMNLRAVTDSYEPGSVFKTLVAGAAIDLGLMTPDTTFDVPAVVKAGDDDVRDADKRDYGMEMSLREIMRRSSNTGMILVGKEIGADDFADYLDAYGIGSPSGVDFPGESAGIVKERDEYDGASVAAMSFGQALAVPPVQVLRASTGIANGGIMSVPHFLKAKRGEEVDWDSKQERCISKEAADQVASMMQTVVEEGTGKGAGIEGYVIAGKTGTAQRASEGGYLQGSYMSSFLGFATPGDAHVMTYITLDGTANSSDVVLEPFRRITRAAIDAMQV